MLFKLSWKNMKRSMRDYAIYMFTLIVGVAVFYVFNAIDSQTAMLEITKQMKDYVDTLMTVLSWVSVFVAFVLGFLIVYATRFLMKRRNKEFALYLLLGMSKGRISAMLFLETVMVGVISLAAGLGIGIAFSQFMSAFTANLFEAEMSAYRFTVSGTGIVKTILYFGIMYAAVMFMNGFMIGRFQLIDLIQSGKRSEVVRLKQPVLCVLIFLLSCTGLGYAYVQVSRNVMEIGVRDMTVIIIIGAVATFFIFWSVSGMFLRLIMSMKSSYYRSLNCFTFRQLSSRINTMVVSMTLICLMLFVTICLLSSTLTLRKAMNDNLRELCPADFEIEYEVFEDAGAGMTKAVPADIVKIYEGNGYDVTEEFAEYVHFHGYADPDFTFAAFFGDRLGEVMESFQLIDFDIPEEIIKVSDYNALMELYGKEPITLGDGEYLLLCDVDFMKTLLNPSLNHEIQVFGHTLKPRYAECQDGFISLTAQHDNIGIFVVPDDVTDEQYAAGDYFMGIYDADTKEERYAVEEAVLEKFDKGLLRDEGASGEHYEYNIMWTSKIDIAAAAAGVGTVATFLGLYIGVIFLISCGVILALKELSESVDNIPQYEILKKLGVEEGEISKSLFLQTGIFFLLPLLLAAVHSIYGMRYAAHMMEIFFAAEKLLPSMVVSCVLILVIYGGYFVVTYVCSRRIIR